MEVVPAMDSLKGFMLFAPHNYTLLDLVAQKGAAKPA
jgi:hypothetical protein